MRDFRLGSVVTALVVATVTAACGSSTSDDGAAGGAGSGSAVTGTEESWAETTKTLGVTMWASAPPDDANATGAQITGYDDAHQVRSQFVIEQGQDKKGNATIRLRSVVQGPAVVEFRRLDDLHVVIVEDTFKDHPDAKKALDLVMQDLRGQTPSDGSLVHTASLHALDQAPLVGNQEQLICKDAKGKACEKPPGNFETGRDCLVGAGGLAGLGCLTTGAETVGVGCVVSAMAAVAGGLICADDVSKRNSCKCVTPCAAQCQQKFNRQYACPTNNTRSCSSAAAQDRVDEAACTKGCDAK